MREGQKQTFARYLRKNMTDAERAMWRVLRNRTLAGCKFLRQYPIARYIVDCACIKRRLVIELNGGQHADSDTDSERTSVIEAFGYRVLGFWNNNVLTSPDAVLSVIFAALEPDSLPGQ